MSAAKKILFVCTGNSCRSVMAQGLLRHALEKKGYTDFQVLSAGVSTVGGLGATPETIEVMQQEGIDVSSHMSQPATPELIQSADVIFCMEQFQRDLIAERIPESESKLFMLKTFKLEKQPPDPNIGDPIGRPLEVYESCLMTIKEAVGRVERWLEKQAGSKTKDR